MKTETILLGAGGHARILIDAMLVANELPPEAALDNNPALWGTEMYDVPILGGDDMLAQLRSEGAHRFVVGAGSIRATRLRQTLFELGCQHGLVPRDVAHPSAIVSPRAHCDVGVQLLAGCVVGASACLHENVVVNTCAIVEHDCVVGSHVHIASGVRLSGAVTVGARAHIGVGAIVKQEVTIGADAVVGAGAVVVKDVPPGAVVVGIPAREIRRFAA